MGYMTFSIHSQKLFHSYNSLPEVFGFDFEKMVNFNRLQSAIQAVQHFQYTLKNRYTLRTHYQRFVDLILRKWSTLTDYHRVLPMHCKKSRVVPSRFNYAALFKCEKEILF